jgi:hypothetical protein
MRVCLEIGYSLACLLHEHGIIHWLAVCDHLAALETQVLPLSEYMPV